MKSEFDKAMTKVLKNNEKKLYDNLTKKQLAKNLAHRDFILKLYLINESILESFKTKTKKQIIIELLENKEELKCKQNKK